MTVSTSVTFHLPVEMVEQFTITDELHKANTVNSSISHIDPDELKVMIDKHWGNKDGELQDEELADFFGPLVHDSLTSFDSIVTSAYYSYYVLALEQEPNGAGMEAAKKMRTALGAWEAAKLGGDDEAAQKSFAELKDIFGDAVLMRAE